MPTTLGHSEEDCRSQENWRSLRTNKQRFLAFRWACMYVCILYTYVLCVCIVDMWMHTTHVRTYVPSLNTVDSGKEWKPRVEMVPCLQKECVLILYWPPHNNPTVILDKTASQVSTGVASPAQVHTVEHSYSKLEIPGQTVCYKQEFVISEQFPMRYCSTWSRSLLCYIKNFVVEEFVIRVFHCTYVHTVQLASWVPQRAHQICTSYQRYLLGKLHCTYLPSVLIDIVYISYIWTEWSVWRCGNRNVYTITKKLTKQVVQYIAAMRHLYTLPLMVSCTNQEIALTMSVC